MSEKILRKIARRSLERIGLIEKEMSPNLGQFFEEKRHLIKGSIERSYYLAGHLQALKDIREALAGGDFSDLGLDSDGGPRIPSYRIAMAADYPDIKNENDNL